MHMGIAIIVYGPNQEEATMEAKEIADGLCENHNPFDYHADFGNDPKFEGFDFSKALPYSDPKVADLLTLYHNYTKQTFMESLNKLREALNGNTNDELWADRDMWRYYAYQVGMYRGSAVHVYDSDGEGIRDDQHLFNVLDKWKKALSYTKYDKLDIYVYFQDVHY